MPVEIFVDDDDAYVKWVEDHPDGFVVNTTRAFGATYRKVHAATCHSVTVLQPGYETWTHGEYVKVCAESRDDLDDWGGPLGDGCYCNH